MGGVLVLAELDGPGAGVRPASIELIGAGRALCEQRVGALTVALIGHDAEAKLDALDVAGVQEIVAVPTPCEHFEAHVWQVALEGLIEKHSPTVVLAGHTLDSLNFAPALAAHARHGFASDVIGLSWGESGVLARRGAYGERLVAELDFPNRETVVLLLRAGAFAAPDTNAQAPHAAPLRTRLDVELKGRERTERVQGSELGRQESSAGEPDIAGAGFLLSIGRGVGAPESIPGLQRLAERMGATLSVSGPLVEKGWAPRTRKVGQTGRTVAPRVYLALGISGAAQHLAGIAEGSTIIAVNSDPGARIFDVADYGAVADLFAVAAELERKLG
ncbi:MAG TPA: electron transfer flavoprotein subunit alpha/FixB family protein [Solirubrobacteraceae bacterium]|jgi:electron transfer flavoprotein alpha subunit|nr:electron transfer flavoprotein subunit alpha/FixB family protein [Solirubrobacteraceae bacterium]